MKPFLTMLCLLSFTAMVGCATTYQTEAKRDNLLNESNASLDRFKAEDPSADAFLSGSAGYAVFPHVGKGAAGVGGAYGKGVLYENGKLVGYCDMTQASIGPQVGAQEYSEMIVFESQSALNRFKQNDFAFTAVVSAVAIKSGAAQTAKYDNGVAVFTRTDGGLMAEAAVGGQKFTYRSWDRVEQDMRTEQEHSARIE